MQAVLILFIIFLQASIQFLRNMDIVLALLIAIAVKRNKTETLLYFFTGGLLQDVLFSVNFANTLVKTLIAVFVSYLKNFVTLESDKLCMALAAVFTPISIVMSQLAMQFFHKSEIFHVSFMSLILSTLLNILLAPVFFRILKDE